MGPGDSYHGTFIRPSALAPKTWTHLSLARSGWPKCLVSQWWGGWEAARTLGISSLPLLPPSLQQPTSQKYIRVQLSRTLPGTIVVTSISYKSNHTLNGLGQVAVYSSRNLKNPC